MYGILCALALSALVAASNAAAFENPDRQAPEDLARARASVERDFEGAVSVRSLSLRQKTQILSKYAAIDPKHEVPSDLLANALVFFDANRDKFNNQNYLSIVNFKSRSDAARFFLVSLLDGSVEKYHTTHGAGSDVDQDGIAESFGNVIDSGKSSLGFVRTAEVYQGTYKRALRLDGLSTTNSNIRERAVVFHGWDGAHESNVLQGLSLGCIAVDWRVKDAILDKIKEGSLMYVGVSKK
jgi:hypothetical protein